ncbi:hypothetical protein PMM47T1_09756 [Pseudomonas sp. M47T1]|nr:hypothetical protein PMM47T1_09756 [Pseudomonas sp. M47T1]
MAGGDRFATTYSAGNIHHPSRPFFNDIPSPALVNRRVRCVRQACFLANVQASLKLRQRFANLNIQTVLADLLDAAQDLAKLIAASALTGAALGSVAGLFLGGVGAAPGAVTGGMFGLKVGTWIVGVMGLAALAEDITKGLPPVLDAYAQGIRTAWNGPREQSSSLLGNFSDDGNAAWFAASMVADAHENLIILVLSAMAAYLARGAGNASVLASQMRDSKRGGRIAQWMLNHEERLKQHPDLKPREQQRGLPHQRSPELEPQRDKETRKGKANPETMPLHHVDCFKADRLPEFKVSEFERQLGGQEGGLNALTVEEFLENVANPVARNGKIARDARRRLEEVLIERFFESFFQEMTGPAARKMATIKAKNTMANLAALHNPDLSAGGKDAISDFGDRQVNSTIGPQWKTKIEKLKGAAEQVSPHLRKSTTLNVKLTRC